ncbi:MAG: DUF6427 family protein [Bacteroidota bacterium]
MLILVRLPAFFYGVPLLIPELKWQLTGEQLAAGNLLYVDVLDNVSPFSAIVYAVIHFFVGRSTTAYHVLAFILTAIQIFYFTLLTHKKGLFKERNYVPGLILILFYSLSFDFYTLSPALMANLFLLLAFSTFLSQIEKYGASDEVFEIGVYIGIAFLFYPPTFIFFLWIILALNLFTGIKLRQQFLVIFGLLFPLAVVAIWYFIDGHFANFIQYFLWQVFEKRQFILNDFKGLLSSFIFPLIIGVLGFFVVLGSSKYNNFQTRAQQIILLWFVSGILSVALMPYLAPMQFMLFVIPLAYFAILYFENFKKKWLAELIFIVLFLGVLLNNYQAFVPRLSKINLSKLDKLRLENKNKNFDIRDKKVLVLGNDLTPYLYNKTATPYINWSLSRSSFVNIDNYENVIDIIQNFEKEAPEYIFDQENLLPKVFQRIPSLNNRYTKISDGLYRLK